MEIIFHTGKGSDQSLREFDEKRADFLMRELAMKKRLLSFEEFAKDAQPEVLFTLIHSIVERIYITTDGSTQKCHVYIKGCATEDYSDVLGAVGYIKQESALPVVSYMPPMCDLDYYSIRTKVPEKSNLQNNKGRCDRDHKKAVQRDESGNHRGRGVPRPHPSSGEYPTVHEYSTVCGDAQEQKRPDDLR